MKFPSFTDQGNSISIEVTLDLPLATFRQSGRVAQPVDGEAVFGGEGHAVERLLTFQSLQIWTGLDVSIDGLSLESGLVKPLPKLEISSIKFKD